MSALARRWIRYLTAMVIAGSIVVLVVVGVQRSRRMARPAGNRPPPVAEGEVDDPAVGIYTGFEYVESIAGKAISPHTAEFQAAVVTPYADAAILRAGKAMALAGSNGPSRAIRCSRSRPALRIVTCSALSPPRPVILSRLPSRL